jgi:hypothetical protein
MKTRTSKSLALVMAAGLFASIGVASTPAVACGGEWAPEVEIDHRIQGVAFAEKQFDDGHALSAAATVIRVMPHVGTLNPHRSKLVERAQRILAVAIARGEGELSVAKEVPDYAQGKWLGKTADHRQANLGWAVETLRQVSKIKKDDTTVKTDLAEALAKVPAHQAEARQMLEDLAKRDLVSTPEAYAALAKLRSLAGDAKGQKLALERCAKMAKSIAVCGETGASHAQGETGATHAQG